MKRIVELIASKTPYTVTEVRRMCNDDRRITDMCKTMRLSEDVKIHIACQTWSVQAYRLPSYRMILSLVLLDMGCSRDEIIRCAKADNPLLAAASLLADDDLELNTEALHLEFLGAAILDKLS